LPEGQLGEIVFNNPVAQRATVGDATTEEVWYERPAFHRFASSPSRNQTPAGFNRRDV
jgi:hypothetical protein